MSRSTIFFTVVLREPLPLKSCWRTLSRFDFLVFLTDRDCRSNRNRYAVVPGAHANTFRI
jgi:hypothetical protein